MDTSEISKIIIDKMTEVCGPFSSVQPEMCAAFERNHLINPEAYRREWAPNWSWIDCEAAPHLLAFCLQYPEFSHFSHRNRYSVTIYWHHDTAPNRVISVGAFHPDRLQEAHKLIGDEVGAALAWAEGYEG